MEKPDYASAIKLRNKSWKNNKNIPKWVKMEEVDLDHYCTKPAIAKVCWEIFLKYLEKENVDISGYTFIEPSAGQGAFFNLLPKNRRIGIDIVKENPEYIQQDFLSWEPEDKSKKYICIGNPPFGYRSWLALSFVNHAGKFSDYIAFIVPMAFQSNGKSNVKDRIKGFHLTHQSSIPKESFVDIEGKTIKVNSLFQIWKKGEVAKKPEKTCDNFIEIFTVDLRKERKCGHNKMHRADFFLQRSFFNEPPKLVKNFNEVKYVCGYGIIIKKDKEKVLEILNNTDWKKLNNLAVHNVKHISMEHIRKALIRAGLVDNKREIKQLTLNDRPHKNTTQSCTSEAY
ncbi:hypothetical protein HYW76_04150 [Candidatus Pacearchaeota archaeon]|nr:hypothetical protein [Candidatus Pacearchaeota archaeon]